MEAATRSGRAACPDGYAARTKLVAIHPFLVTANSLRQGDSALPQAASSMKLAYTDSLLAAQKKLHAASVWL
jgi:hypothetical protein